MKIQSIISLFLVSLSLPHVNTKACNLVEKEVIDNIDISNSDISYYRNPLFQPDLADPTFIKADDGWFYAYGTENEWSPGAYYMTPVIRSNDLISWKFIANAFQSKPSWKSSGYIWAPQIVFNSDEETYYLYYSISDWGDSNPGIGVATSKNPAGPFEDMGKVLDTQSSGVRNSIDPFYISLGKGRNKKDYLFWGSFEGIWGVEMTDMKTPKLNEKFKIAGNAFEGTYIYEYNNKFYFFGSSGSCCDGANTQYRLSVAAADDIKGPYQRKDGKSILDDGVEGTPFLRGDKNTGWIGPGHNGEIIKDDNGRYFILYHAVAYNNPLLPNGATRRPLMMDEVDWRDGWPGIKNGIPSATQKTAPYFKDISSSVKNNRLSSDSTQIYSEGKQLKIIANPNDMQKIKVFNANGITCISTTFTGNANFELPCGLYIVELKNTDSTSFITKVLIK